MAGSIVLAATPIGNVGDASARLIDALATADVVAAEDTRRLRALAARLGVAVKGEVLSLNDHNERERAGDLVSRAAAGAMILVVSDAGMPTVSDPGFRVVVAAAEAGVAVTVLPGPSAALAALAVSGLATDRFCFEGFLPRKAGERATALAALGAEPRTMVFFEAPHRLAATLAAMAEAFGSARPATVSRELTKTYEETRRGGLAELAVWAHAAAPKGEFVVVVAGAPKAGASFDALVSEALARAASGERLKEAVRDVSAVAGVSSRELYAAVLEARAAP
ncbi:MAG TPA: 16S rRNA (cytidine(1402)-2'-O)-methyltransferase [Demequinaceae bacterium]